MQTRLYLRPIALLCVAAGILQTFAAPHPSVGLWVGEVILKKVNEVTVAPGANAPDPNVPTPTKDAANLRLILHVDTAGQVRLLKSVALIDRRQTNAPDQIISPTNVVPGSAEVTLNETNIALLTDPALFANYRGIAQRITAVAFDFSDYSGVQAAQAVQPRGLAAAAAAAAAAIVPGATSNSVRTAAFGATAPTPPVPPNGTLMTNIIQRIVNATYQALLQARFIAGANPVNGTSITRAANDEAVKAISEGVNVAGAVVGQTVPLTNQLAAGSVVTGEFFLGAAHPTNPFRHRKHPDHTLGYDITRAITLVVSSPTNGASYEYSGYGVDRLTGIYKEELKGLHKLLGPQQNIGLKTEGTFTLNRLTRNGVLNQ